jgi:hypothetical protein
MVAHMLQSKYDHHRSNGPGYVSDQDSGIEESLQPQAYLAIVYPSRSPRARVLAKALARGAKRVPGVKVSLLLGAGAGPRLPLVVARYIGQDMDTDCSCHNCSATVESHNTNSKTSCRPSKNLRLSASRRQCKRHNVDGAQFAPPVTTQQELSKADGVLFGMHGVPPDVDARVRAFSELLGALWHEDALRGKLTGAYFTDRHTTSTPITGPNSDMHGTDSDSSSRGDGDSVLAPQSAANTTVPDRSLRKKQSPFCRSRTNPENGNSKQDIMQEEKTAFTLLTYWSEEYARVNQLYALSDNDTVGPNEECTDAIDSVEAAAELRGERFARQLLRCKAAIDAQQTYDTHYGSHLTEHFSCTPSDIDNENTKKSSIAGRRRWSSLRYNGEMLHGQRALYASTDCVSHSAPVSRRTSQHRSVHFATANRQTDSGSSNNDINNAVVPVITRAQQALVARSSTDTGRVHRRYTVTHGTVPMEHESSHPVYSQRASFSSQPDAKITVMAARRATTRDRYDYDVHGTKQSSTKSTFKMLHKVGQFVRTVARSALD